MATEKTVSAQPGATPGMMVTPGGGNRNAKNIPLDQDGTREWSNGLFSCCGEPGVCLKSWCCACAVYAQNKQRLEHLQTSGSPDPEHGGDFCSGECMTHCLLQACCGIGWVLQLGPRGAMRTRYSIRGSTLGDLFSIWCCLPCALTQEHRELELEERSFNPPPATA